MEDLNDLKKEVDVNCYQVQDMVRAIVNDYTKPLDDYIDSVKELLLSDKPIPTEDLNKITIRIPTLNYALIAIRTKMDIGKGVSAESSVYKENESLLKATGTVSEKQAWAKNATFNYKIIKLAYNAASSLIQAKIDAAYEIQASAKKIINMRIEEMKLTQSAGNSF